MHHIPLQKSLQRTQKGSCLTCRVLLGPSEPKITMNSYLTPFVEELKQGWYSGFNDKTLN